MADMIDIRGLDKAEVLCALYDKARAQGLGALVAANTTPMTRERARALLNDADYFDYLDGRVLKIDLGGDAIRTALYDRDNGEGAAWRALEGLLAKRTA